MHALYITMCEFAWERVKIMGLVQRLKTIEQLKRVKQFGSFFVKKKIIININNVFRMIYNCIYNIIITINYNYIDYISTL